MGVSHAFQILGALRNNCELVIIDPSLIARIISKILLPKRSFFKDLKACGNSRFDLVALCSPPFDRPNIVAALENKSRFALIEKPVLTTLPKNAMSGYVMQYCPTSSQVADMIVAEQIGVTDINIKVQSNVDFSMHRHGWRTSSEAGGLISEFLGHGLSFGMTPIFRGADLEFEGLKVGDVSANRVEFMVSAEGIKVSCILEGSTKVRKTRYSCEYKTHTGEEIVFDPYEIKYKGKTVSVTQVVGDISYFLRSYEFSIQCDRLINHEGDYLTRATIFAIEALINKIKCE